MKKIIIFLIILISLLTISCAYAEENSTNPDDNQNNISPTVASIDANTNITDNPDNEKYYCKDELTNQEYYFYKNGSVSKVDNSSFTNYEYWLYSGKNLPYNTKYKILDNVLNKEQIDFYLKNRHFSYALAYIKAHGGNLTYDEVFNAESVMGIFDASDWRFYNNGTVECSLLFLGEGFENSTYSKSYITSIFGTAGWSNEPISKGVAVFGDSSIPYEIEGYIENSYRFPNGEFSRNMLDGASTHNNNLTIDPLINNIPFENDTTQNKTINDENNISIKANNTQTQQHNPNILINIETKENTQVTNIQTPEKSNTKMLYTNNSKNEEQDTKNTTTNKNKIEKSNNTPVKSISNIIIVSLMCCLLAPIGAYKKSKK